MRRDAVTEHQYFINTDFVRKNLYNRYPFVDQSAIREWYGNDYTNDLFTFSLQSIEKFYRRLAQSQSKPAVHYFAEKAPYGAEADWASQMVWELYPRPKEIFLVRDFRDQFCSLRSFHIKRGRNLTKIYGGMTTEEYIKFTGRRLITMLENWQHRQSGAFLLRYEDLILRPQETLMGVFKYLEVEQTPVLVEKILALAAVETPQTQRHKTTSSVSSSIGRWKTDLDEPLKTFINEQLGESLRSFGYEV